MNPFADLEPDRPSRRVFLARASQLSMAAAATPFALNLAALGEAAAQSATDYKALVCVFLYGGNDYANTVVPYDTGSHALYTSLRSNVAIARESLAATALNPATPLPGGVQYALAPTLSSLVPLFDAGQMSVLLNIGTLAAPTTKAQYQARSVPLPPKLFSHNDQQSYWQASLPEGGTSGWGGRMGDLFAAGNGNSTFTCVGVGGNAVYLAGRSAVQYQVSTNGAVAFNGLRNPLYGSAACSQALRSLLTSPRSHYLEGDYARVTRRSVEANELVASAVSGVSLSTPFPTPNGLADQLKMVARLIGARQALGAKRQVFMVSLGGFDNHDSLRTTHPELLGRLGNALAAFQSALVELGVFGQVTTFTASDFGRTLLSNNDGSDHGWGGMQFVMGGAVRGRSFVGTPPQLADNGPDDVGQGRLLPTTSVEQFGATLATWFGVSGTDLQMVLPNLQNFGVRDLGFMAPA
jgi:uncharacterized protein (DUF1501 family)